MYVQNLQEHLPGLDRLRALAIAMVFLFHYSILSGGELSGLSEWVAFGWTGVDLFFVLSGYLISLPLFQQIRDEGSIDLRAFWIKRAFRILPLYFLVLGLYFLFPSFREKEALPPIWKFLTFTQNFGLNLKDEGTFSHCWSLCVEEHFYLLLPLVLYLLLRLRLPKFSAALFLIILSVTIICRYLSYQYVYLPEVNPVKWYQYIYYPSYNRLDGLLLGVLIAALRVFRADMFAPIFRNRNLLFVLGLGLLFVAWFVFADMFACKASVWGFTLVAAGFACLVAASLRSSVEGAGAAGILPVFLARHSYAIYLTHKGVIHMTRVGLQDYIQSEILLLVLCGFSCCLVGAFLYYSVERPFLLLRNSLLNN